MTVRIINADIMDGLAQLPDESMHCVVTSPPYWGLRDYGVAGQLGLEPTLAEHISRMVTVFREVRRVMRKDATLWLNYGDCYATSVNGRSAADTKALGNDDRTFRDKPFSTVGGVLKPKDLCMIPNRLAIAMQEDGWWVRAENIWGKTNPMPDSVKDRPGTSHEKIWLMTRSARYWYDAEAVHFDLSPKTATIYGGLRHEPADASGLIKAGNLARSMPERRGRSTYGRHTLGEAVPDKQRRVGDAREERRRGHARRHQGFNDRWDAMTKAEQCESGRGLRNYEPAPLVVWEMATKPFPEAHFATFPPELAERCILAGCPKDGVVLDPFAGAGTTCLVADRLQRDAIGIELNPEYAAIAEKRINTDRGALLDIMEAAE